LLGAGRASTGWPGRFSNSTGSGRRSEEHTSELQSRFDLVCRLLLEKKKRERKASESIWSRLKSRARPAAARSAADCQVATGGWLHRRPCDLHDSVCDNRRTACENR